MNASSTANETPTANTQDCVDACPSLKYREWFAETLHSDFLYYQASLLGLINEDNSIDDAFDYDLWEGRYAGVWLTAFDASLAKFSRDYDDEEYVQILSEDAAWDAAQEYFEIVTA